VTYAYKAGRNFLSHQRQNRYAAHEADEEWLSINQLHRAAADNESRVVFAADGVLNKLRKSRFCGVRELGDAYFAFNQSKNNCGNNSGHALARGAARELSRKGWGRTSVAIIIALPPRHALGMKQSQSGDEIAPPPAPQRLIRRVCSALVGSSMRLAAH
jgi:hypothetical protein